MPVDGKLNSIGHMVSIKSLPLEVHENFLDHGICPAVLTLQPCLQLGIHRLMVQYSIALKSIVKHSISLHSTVNATSCEQTSAFACRAGLVCVTSAARASECAIGTSLKPQNCVVDTEWQRGRFCAQETQHEIARIGTYLKF